MPCGWSAASSRALSLSPPRHRKAFHEAVLQEILEERVVSSRGRRNPRAVRKMSGFPVRPNQANLAPIRDGENYIIIIK